MAWNRPSKRQKVNLSSSAACQSRMLRRRTSKGRKHLATLRCVLRHRHRGRVKLLRRGYGRTPQRLTARSLYDSVAGKVRASHRYSVAREILSVLQMSSMGIFLSRADSGSFSLLLPLGRTLILTFPLKRRRQLPLLPRVIGEVPTTQQCSTERHTDLSLLYSGDLGDLDIEVDESESKAAAEDTSEGTFSVTKLALC